MCRDELSKKNKYWLPKHRKLELKHFCFQYHDMVRKVHDIDYIIGSALCDDVKIQKERVNKLEELAIESAALHKNIEIIEQAAAKAGGDIAEWLLRGVTSDISYTALQTRNIPCCRNEYYRRYYKFFHILDGLRE